MSERSHDSNLNKALIVSSVSKKYKSNLEVEKEEGDLGKEPTSKRKE